MRALGPNGDGMFLDDEIAFVKSQIEHHKRSVEHFRKKDIEIKARRHSGILRRFEDILVKMEAANAPASVSLTVTPEDAKIGSRLGDVMDLPEELRAQLVSVQYDEAEMQIVSLVRDSFGGVATIDEIFVGLYRTHGISSPREALANKIYRMTRKELLFSVSGRKGVYTTEKPPVPVTEQKEVT